MTPANIILADDHQLVTDGLRLMLTDNQRWQVVAEARDGRQLLEILSSISCHLIITDLSMPGMKGIDLIQTLKTRHPEIPVLVLTMHDDEEIVREIILAEAEGYLLKNSGKQEVLAAVEDLLAGKTHYTTAVLDYFLKEYRQSKKTVEPVKTLSPREAEILQLIMAEYNSREIADMLHIGKQTVDTHRAHIMEKTGAKTLVGLIKYALQNGINPGSSI
jgi:DNA-binding NarL/FixJ family response regulator